MIYQSELDCIKRNITAAVAIEANRLIELERGGYEADWSENQKKVLDYWILSMWQQNDDGTTNGENYITQAEFDSLIDYVRTYAACVS